MQLARSRRSAPKAQRPSSDLRHFRSIERRRAFRHRQSLRQVHGEARALAFLARDIDAAVMQIDRQLDQIKPDAGADDARDIAAAVIALEQPVEIVWPNAD